MRGLSAFAYPAILGLRIAFDYRISNAEAHADGYSSDNYIPTMDEEHCAIAVVVRSCEVLNGRGLTPLHVFLICPVARPLHGGHPSGFGSLTMQNYK